MKTLKYYVLRAEDWHQFDSRNEPRLGLTFTTMEAAIAVAKSILETRMASQRLRLAAETKCRPDSARRAFEDEKRHACETETRIAYHEILWLPKADEDNDILTLRGHVTLIISTDIRERWREAIMKTTIAPDGSTVITHELREPGEWGAWHPNYSSDAGVQVSQTTIEVKMYVLTFDDDADLAAWVDGGPVCMGGQNGKPTKRKTKKGTGEWK